MNKGLNDWVDEVHGTAKEKGWHDQDLKRTALEMHMLMVSELAEATESARKGEPPIWQAQANTQGGHFTDANLARTIKKVEPQDGTWSPNLKPEGEAVELADCVIRIMDYFGAMGWDLERVLSAKHEYNKTRAFRHGGKLK